MTILGKKFSKINKSFAKKGQNLMNLKDRIYNHFKIKADCIESIVVQRRGHEDVGNVGIPT